MMKVLLFVSLIAGGAAQQHPTLPTSWVSETIEPGPGGKPLTGVEAYHFVAKPTRDNPSAIWSNYTGCERLIYDEGPVQKRFLFKCDGT